MATYLPLNQERHSFSWRCSGKRPWEWQRPLWWREGAWIAPRMSKASLDLHAPSQVVHRRPRTCAFPELSPSCILWDAGRRWGGLCRLLGTWYGLGHLLSTRSQSVACRVAGLVRAWSQLHRSLLAFHRKLLLTHIPSSKQASTPLLAPPRAVWTMHRKQLGLSKFAFPLSKCLQVWSSMCCSTASHLREFKSQDILYAEQKGRERKTTGRDFRRWFRCPRTRVFVEWPRENVHSSTLLILLWGSKMQKTTEFVFLFLKYNL